VPSTPTRQPALFVGHGNPMNAVEENRWSQGFRRVAGLLPRPRAILAISAHWFVDGTHLTGAARPETIHDFSGFPDESTVRYPAAGDRPGGRWSASGRSAPRWCGLGLDHGTWSVLVTCGGRRRPGGAALLDAC
jgi:4,5-DOPA dioxygenase extradiol